MKKIKKIIMPIVYKLYNFVSISLVIILFISRSAWNPHGNIRVLRKSI
jgi:hypothetical protein